MKRHDLLAENMLPTEDAVIIAQAHKHWPNNQIFQDAVQVKNNFTCPSIPINSFVDCELFHVTNTNTNSGSSVLLSEVIATTQYTVIVSGSRT